MRRPPAAGAGDRRTLWTPLRSVSGPRPRASKWKTADGYPLNWWPSSRRPPPS